MKFAVAYPPIPSPKGVPLLSQNRQFQWFSRPTYIYPVVPACAATMASKAGHQVTWLDGIAEEWTEDRFMTELLAASPDLILMESKTPVIKRTWDWVRRIKTSLPNTKIALAGDHVTAMPDESFDRSQADFILIGGDYDFLAVNILENMAGRAVLETGIRSRHSATRDTVASACKHDMASLPHIDRDLTKWHLYSTKNGNFRKLPGTYIMSGRDCWHGRCTFCSWTTLYPTFRVRKPEDVVDEIGTLVDRCGIREIMDDTGTFPVGDWLRKFCRLMIDRGYNKRVTMDCNMRFGALTREDYALMKQAGFRFVLFGLESANQSTLDRLQKGLRVDDILAGVRAASSAGLDVHVTVMFGYPWETPDDVNRTVALARDLLIRGLAYTLQVTLVIPYPGTPLFREAGQSGWLTTRDWDDYDMRTNVMKGDLPEECIKDAIRRVYRAFLHPVAIWNRILHTRHIGDDIAFYWRGIRSVLGHLRDFRNH